MLEADERLACVLRAQRTNAQLTSTRPHAVAQGISVCLDLAMSYICTPPMLVLAVGRVLTLTPHLHAPLFVYYSVVTWVSISIPVPLF